MDTSKTFCRERFADGAESIHMLNGTIRLDLFTLQPGDNGNQPAPQVTERLVMPLSGALQLYDTLGKVIDKLVADGIIGTKKQENNNWDVQK